MDSAENSIQVFDIALPAFHNGKTAMQIGQKVRTFEKEDFLNFIHCSDEP
jgi:hypothetical protein